jgi:hypothetical protein
MSDNFSSLNFSEQENYSATASAGVSTATVSTAVAVESTTSTAVESAATSTSVLAWRLPQEVATSINAIAKIAKIFFIVQKLNLVKNVAGKVGFEPTNFSLTVLTFKPFDETVNHDYRYRRMATTAKIFSKTSCPYLTGMMESNHRFWGCQRLSN